MASAEKRADKIVQSGNAIARSARGEKDGGKFRSGHRFSPEQKRHALLLISSGIKREEIAKALGASTESLRLWVNRAQAEGSMSVHAAAVKGNGRQEAEQPSSRRESSPQEAGGSKTSFVPLAAAVGLSEAERDAVLELKRKHPSFGPAQIRAQLRRFRGWRLSRKAIGRVLLQSGFELVHRGSRPKGEELIRFEAPRPNFLWQMDFAELRVGSEKFHLLVALDDFSRFVVAHALCDSPSSEAAVRLLHEAVSRHGKPEAIRTDRGGAFLANSEQQDFARVLETELIDHVVGRPYHPQGGGKVEAIIGTIRRELWDVEQFYDRPQAERRLSEFLDRYNNCRAHMGIDGLTPADRYHGRGAEVLAAISDISRHRQAATAQQLNNAGIFEEISGLHRSAPLEVLRLMLCDGVMELRFCGARVRLGRIEI